MEFYKKVDKIRKREKGLEMLKKSVWIGLGIVMIFLAGCSEMTVTTTPQPIPSAKGEKSVRISLFGLQNYTDTPRAGMRSANLIEGVLSAHGYRIVSHTDKSAPSTADAQKIAKEDGSAYFILGGVSEWRYKAGIDGEPAVSLRFALYDTASAKLIWSATGSKSEWGNASLGTLAQELLEEMVQKSIKSE